MTRRFSETIVIGILHHLEPEQIYALNPSKFLRIYPELRKLYLMGRILAETRYANNTNFCRYLEKPYGSFECSEIESPNPDYSYSFLGDYACETHQLGGRKINYTHQYDSSSKLEHANALKLHTLTDVKNTLPEIFEQPPIRQTYSYNAVSSHPLSKRMSFFSNSLIMGCYLEADTAEHLQEFLTNIAYIRLEIGGLVVLNFENSLKLGFDDFSVSNYHLKQITDTKIAIFPEFLNGFPNIGWGSGANIHILSKTNTVSLYPHIIWSYKYYDLTVTIDLFQRRNYERLISQTYTHGIEKIVNPIKKIQLGAIHCVSRMRLKFVNFEYTTVPTVTIKDLQLNIDGRIYDYTNLLTISDDVYDLLNFQTHDLKQLKFINFSAINYIELRLEIEGNLDDLYLDVTYDYWNLIQSVDGMQLNLLCTN